jgi:hypothetical protein
MDNKAVLGGSVAAALAVGGAAGYLVARKQLETKYELLAQQEIEEARDYFRTLYKKGKEYASPEAAAEALLPENVVESLRLYSGGVPPELSGELTYHRAHLLHEVGKLAEEEPVELSVFDQVVTEHDIEAEVRERTEEAPYIISKDEFFEDAANHSQSTISYYAGDGVLADEHDEPIEDIDRVVGDNNIPRFGHRSEDPNVLYVRNHSLGTDYEITLSKGKYSVEVAGLQEE